MPGSFIWAGGGVLLLSRAASVTTTFSLQLETAEQAALEKSEAASATREELEAVRLRVESLGAQLHKQQKEVRTLCVDPGGEHGRTRSPSVCG